MSEIISIFANGSKIKCSKKNLGSFIKMSRQINGVVEITEDSCNGSKINSSVDTKWYFKDVNINGIPIKDGMKITFIEFAPK